MDLELDSHIKRVVAAECARRSRLPKWWPRQAGHAAGGFAAAFAAGKMGFKASVTIPGVLAGALFRELVIDRDKPPFYKHGVDILFWVAGATLGAMTARRKR